MWNIFLSYFQVIFVLTCPTVLYPLGRRFDSGRTSIQDGQRFVRIQTASQLKPEPEGHNSSRTSYAWHDARQSHDSVRIYWGRMSKTCHVEANGQLELVTMRPMANLKLSRWGQLLTCHVEANLSRWGLLVTLRPMANLSRWGQLLTMRLTSHVEAKFSRRGLLLTLRQMANLSRWGQIVTTRPTCQVEANLWRWGLLVTLRPMANLSHWGQIVTLRTTCHVEANVQLVRGLLVTLRSTCHI